MCTSVHEPCNRRSNSWQLKTRCLRRDTPSNYAVGTEEIKSVTNNRYVYEQREGEKKKRKDREERVFLRLTERWFGVVACCSCGRASVHHESLKNGPKEAQDGDEGRNGSERIRENR